MTRVLSRGATATWLTGTDGVGGVDRRFVPVLRPGAVQSSLFAGRTVLAVEDRRIVSRRWLDALAAGKRRVRLQSAAERHLLSCSGVVVGGLCLWS